MHLLFINQSLGTGGAETFNLGLLCWLQKKGIRVKSFITNKKFQKGLKKSGIEARIIPLVVDLIGNRRGFLKGILFLLPLSIYYTVLVIANKNADVILMSGFIEKILVTPVAKLFKIPVVWIEFSPLAPVFNKFFRFPKFLYSLVKNMPNKIIVPSNHTLYSLISDTSLSINNFVHIPCAENVDYKNYSNINPETHSVCCVSRLEIGKGQDLLLKAWQEVEDEVSDATLQIVGEGDFVKDLTKIRSELKLKRVNFKGYVNDALKEIAKAEIFVFPTLWPLEGFGLVVLEAMALSKPVVCFDFGPVPEIVSSKTGVIVKKGNTDRLASAIIKLLKDKSLAKNLGQEGRKKYLENYTFEKVGPKYHSALPLR